MSKRCDYKSVCVFSLWVAIIAAAPVRADLIAYDQFVGYTEGNLHGQNQGFGWNAWSIGSSGSDEVTIVTNTGNLVYGSLPTAGGGATVVNANDNTDNSWIMRNLATAITNSGTYYFGFLVQRTGDPSKASFRIQDSTGNNAAGGGAWDSQATWQLYRSDGGSWTKASTGTNETTDVTYFVIKLDWNTPGSHAAYLYVNPADAAALAGSADATYSFSSDWADISKIQGSLVGTSGNVGTMAFDEIRIGTARADMFVSLKPAGTVFTLR